jgi:hypothetical protein
MLIENGGKHALYLRVNGQSVQFEPDTAMNFNEAQAEALLNIFPEVLKVREEPARFEETDVNE